ncbi:excisionase [Thalassotalea sp. ND16A]|uniref:excisionase n=1 Tax=Thalassotalea sp. ND16A TaxID=1535422 RepID=UPI000519FC2C|nr:excisionase [Thalassotalea sp. ND16A]KGJ99890.1 hypothetical protein ND16A_3678 [Thalassotalea sp. ND16A]
MKEVKLKTWWKSNYDEPYCSRRVQRYARLGRILPRPVKMGGYYYVVKNAKYIGLKDTALPNNEKKNIACDVLADVNELMARI